MDNKNVFVRAFDIFLEGLPLDLLIASFMMAFLGIVLDLLIAVATRDPLKKGSPIPFSWNHLWCDNNKQLYAKAGLSVLLIFITLRFSDRFFGEKISMLYAFLIGFGLDYVKRGWINLKNRFFQSNKNVQ